MFGAHLAVGWHAGEAAHLEAAWVQARWATDAALFTLGAGRAKVPMGTVLSSAGDFGRFSLVPLVKRGSLNDDWYDEGVVLTWRGAGDSMLRSVDVGAWRGSGFPGGGDLPLVPALHLQLGHGEVELDGFFAYLQPTGRGTYARDSTSSGHTHGVPNCEVSLKGLVCFDGRVNLLGGSLSWASHDWPVTLVAAALWRDEQGSLYSQNGKRQLPRQDLGRLDRCGLEVARQLGGGRALRGVKCHPGPVRSRGCAGGGRSRSGAQLACAAFRCRVGLQPRSGLAPQRRTRQRTQRRNRQSVRDAACRLDGALAAGRRLVMGRQIRSSHATSQDAKIETLFRRLP